MALIAGGAKREREGAHCSILILAITVHDEQNYALKHRTTVSIAVVLNNFILFTIVSTFFFPSSGVESGWIKWQLRPFEPGYSRGKVW